MSACITACQGSGAASAREIYFCCARFHRGRRSIPPFQPLSLSARSASSRKRIALVHGLARKRDRFLNCTLEAYLIGTAVPSADLVRQVRISKPSFTPHHFRPSESRRSVLDPLVRESFGGRCEDVTVKTSLQSGQRIAFPSMSVRGGTAFRVAGNDIHSQGFSSDNCFQFINTRGESSAQRRLSALPGLCDLPGGTWPAATWSAIEERSRLASSFVSSSTSGTVTLAFPPAAGNRHPQGSVSDSPKYLARSWRDYLALSNQNR